MQTRTETKTEPSKVLVLNLKKNLEQSIEDLITSQQHQTRFINGIIEVKVMSLKPKAEYSSEEKKKQAMRKYRAAVDFGIEIMKQISIIVEESVMMLSSLIDQLDQNDEEGFKKVSSTFYNEFESMNAKIGEKVSSFDFFGG